MTSSPGWLDHAEPFWPHPWGTDEHKLWWWDAHLVLSPFSSLPALAGGHHELAVVLGQRGCHRGLVPLRLECLRGRWAAHLCASPPPHVGPRAWTLGGPARGWWWPHGGGPGVALWGRGASRWGMWEPGRGCRDAVPFPNSVGHWGWGFGSILVEQPQGRSSGEQCAHSQEGAENRGLPLSGWVAGLLVDLSLWGH